MNVIIAEDEILTAMLIKSKVERLGHNVIALAHSGEEVYNQAFILKPDIILMDISMEHRTAGIEACEKIKKINIKIKIIFLSAYEKNMFEDRLKDLNYDGFIDKLEFQTKLEEIFK